MKSGTLPPSWQLGRRPGLDGLRGIAVLLVMATHFVLAPILAGDIGVKIFFTLSGFLITTRLLDEHRDAGRIRLPAFYARRTRRLFPALAVVLSVASLLSLVGMPLDLHLGMVAAIIGYVSNWYLIAHTHLGVVPWGGLGNTWSLAIEEQFYLVWPLLLMVAIRFRHGVVVLASTLALTSLAWSLWSGRTSLATDVSAWCLLAGCALAAAMHQRRQRIVPAWPSLAFLGLVPLGLAPKNLETVAQVVVPLLAVGVIWVVVQVPVAWLEFGPLRWIGVRSYGLYLWHVPVAFLCGYTTWPWLAVAPLGIAVSFALSALSWRYVEAPILRRPTGKFVADGRVCGDPRSNRSVGYGTALSTTPAIPT